MVDSNSTETVTSIELNTVEASQSDLTSQTVKHKVPVNPTSANNNNKPSSNKCKKVSSYNKERKDSLRSSQKDTRPYYELSCKDCNRVLDIKKKHVLCDTCIQAEGVSYEKLSHQHH